MPDAPRVLSFFDGSSFSTKEVIVSHPSEATIRRLFDVFMTGDREVAARMFAEAAVFAYERPGPLHGHYGGHDGIISFWAEQDRRSGGELRPQLIDLVAGDRRVFLW